MEDDILQIANPCRLALTGMPLASNAECLDSYIPCTLLWLAAQLPHFTPATTSGHFSKDSFMQSTVDNHCQTCQAQKVLQMAGQYTKMKLTAQDQGVLQLSEGMNLYPKRAEFQFPNLIFFFTNSTVILSEVISACYFSPGALLNIPEHFK